MSAIRSASVHVAAYRWHRRQGSTHATVAADLLVQRSAIDAMLALVVRDMRAAGWTWVEVGETLNLQSDTARRRYGVAH